MSNLAAVEAERNQLRDMLGEIYLYVGWRYVTKQLTTEQKELWAEALEARWAGMDFEHSLPDRWWLCPTCGISVRANAEDGPHENCTYAQT